MFNWRRLAIPVAAALAAFALVPALAAFALAPAATPTIAIAATSPASPGGPSFTLNTRFSGEPDGAALPQPPNPAQNMTNHGGPVMHNPTLYNIFWLPAGHYEAAGTAVSDTAFENLMNRFWQDVGNNSYYNIVSQYPDGGGAPGANVTFGGSVVDTTNAYPHAGTTADPLTDGDIQAEVHRMRTGQVWTADGNHMFLVYTARNIQECFSSSACTFSGMGIKSVFCAYHTFFNDGGNDTIYAFMGDNALTNGCGPGGGPNGAERDAQVSISSHEFFEAVTDPHLNAWFGPGGLETEIGDKCNSTPSPQNSVGADVYLNGNPYVVQMEWSNAVATCAMSLCKSSMCPTAPNLNKTADAKVTTGEKYNIKVTVQNPSNTDADTKVIVTDTLPSGASYVAFSANPAPTSVVGPVITWNLGVLAVHDTSTITFKAQAGSGLQNGTLLRNCAGVTWADMLANAQPAPSASCADTTAVNQPPVLVLPGDQTGEYHDPMSFTISATDVEASDTLTFKASGLPAGLTLTDNGNRTATISGVPQAVPAVYTVTFSVNDAHNPDVTGTLKITITKEESSIGYTGPTVIANGLPVTLSARLLEDGNPATPISGRNVTLTLGSGGSAQSCPAVTLGNGVGSCTISSVNQPLGPVSITVKFAGDAFYVPSSGSAQAILFAFLARGAFVVGDGSAAVGKAVTFWGSDWASLNSLSAGSAPASFKGFAANTSKPPAKGKMWTTRPGDSAKPPAGPLPSFMGVIVSDSIKKSGPTIAGDTVHIVVVKVNPGYAPNPGHPGTGTVVAIFS